MNGPPQAAGGGGTGEGVCVLGLGLMGLAIAARLRHEGFEVTAWNRGAAGARRGVEAGLRVQPALAEAVAGASTLLLTLSDFEAIDGLLFAPGAPSLDGRRLLQMGTIGPDESRALAAKSAAAGARYLEAPVLGSIPEAGAGTLILMVGGERADFEALAPLLEALGRAPELLGPVGSGAAMKLAMNQLIASLTLGFSASLGLVQAEGLSVDRFMDLLRKSALYAPTFDKKLPRMLGRDYGNPNFPLKHLAKDVELFRRAALAHGIETGVLAAALAVLEKGCAGGRADEDYAALFEAVRGESNAQ